jgi:hypothetical protein
MRELDLSRETIQSQGENIFAHIRHNGLTTKARMHSPDWCKHLAQAAGRSLVSPMTTPNHWPHALLRPGKKSTPPSLDRRKLGLMLMV